MITTKINLNSTIFKATERRQGFSNFVARQAKDFKNLTKRRILDGEKTGRRYRRRGGAGFTRSHQASAKGERPAVDSGRLLNSIDDKRISETSAEVFVGAPYAVHLQEKLDRPIMTEQDAAEAERKMVREGVTLIASIT